jgi:hypothetical protein
MDLSQAIFVPLVALLIAVLCSCGDDGAIRQQAYIKATQAHKPHPTQLRSAGTPGDVPAKYIGETEKNKSRN